MQRWLKGARSSSYFALFVIQHHIFALVWWISELRLMPRTDISICLHKFMNSVPWQQMTDEWTRLGWHCCLRKSDRLGLWWQQGFMNDFGWGIKFTEHYCFMNDFTSCTWNSTASGRNDLIYMYINCVQCFRVWQQEQYYSKLIQMWYWWYCS